MVTTNNTVYWEIFKVNNFAVFTDLLATSKFQLHENGLFRYH